VLPLRKPCSPAICNLLDVGHQALGCFLLTEMQAGVLSGLIVETTATWDDASESFVLHTPSDKAAKNWISQVCVSYSGGDGGVWWWWWWWWWQWWWQWWWWWWQWQWWWCFLRVGSDT
jgi:hypothetical protein